VLAKQRLNQRQVEILARIVANDVPVTWRDSSLALTVYALRSRGLVETIGSDGMWTAVATDAGQHYAECGTYPQRPDGPSEVHANAREAETSTARKLLSANELVARIEAAGGTLTISDPDPATRAWWRSSIQSAIKCGGRLDFTGRVRGDLIVRISASRSDEAPQPLVAPEPAPPSVSDTQFRHPLVAKLQKLIATENAQAHRTGLAVGPLPRVSPGSVNQALRTLDALFIQAEERGYRARPVERPRPRQFARYRLLIGGKEFPIAVMEHGEVLVLKLEDVQTGRRIWHDGTRTRLEHKVEDVLDTLEERVHELDRRREHRAEFDQEITRTRETEAENLRAAYQQAWIAGFLSRQVAAWRLADEVRSMCSQLQRDVRKGAASTATADWITWALEQAERIDPTTRPLTVPVVPEPTSVCLERFEETEPALMLEA